MKAIAIFALLVAAWGPSMAVPPTASLLALAPQTSLGRAIAERDRLMQARRFREALAYAQAIVESLRRDSPNTIELANALTRLGDLHERLAQLDEAERALAEAQAILQKRGESGSALLADVYYQQGFLARRRQNNALAEQKWQASLAIYQKIAPQSREAASCWTGLGVLASDRGDWDEARKRYEAALVIRQKLSPDSLEVAALLNNLGNVAFSAGDLDTATRRYEAALALREKLAPRSAEVAGTLVNLGIVARERNDLSTAESRFGQAIEILEAAAPDTKELATALTYQATIFKDRGDFASAATRLERALKILQANAPESLEMVSCLTNLGQLASERGELDEAERRHQSAFDLANRIAPESLETARSLNNLGNVAAARGDLDNAERRYREALRIRQELAPGSKDVASSLNGLGNVAYGRGDLNGAQQRFEAALAIYQRVSPNSPEAAMCLNNLGLVAQDRGDLDEAERRYQNALALQTKANPQSLEVAKTLNNLALLAYARGNLNEAQTRFASALQVQQKIAPESLDVAMTLNNLGAIAKDLGDLKAAQQRFEASLAIQDRLAPGSLDVARSLNNLGGLLLADGQLAAAQRRFIAALQINDRLAPGSLNVSASLSNLATVAAAAGEQQQLAQLTTQRLGVIADLIEIQGLARASELGAMGRENSEALKSLGRLANPEAFYPWLPTLRAAGLTLQVRARASELLAAEDEQVRAALRDVQTATTRETDWATDPRPTGMTQKQWDDRLLELRSSRQSAELKLALLLKQKDPRLSSDLKVSLAAVQNGIPEDAALIEFLRVSPTNAKPRDTSNDAYGAFVVRRTGDVRFVRLGPAAEIDGLIEMWHIQIALSNDPGATEATFKETEAELVSLGKQLHEKLIAPLGELPESLMIAPDADLNALPFGALVNAQGKFLVETKKVCVVGSGRDLAERPVAAEPGPAAVMAAPSFGATADEIAKSNSGLPAPAGGAPATPPQGTWSDLAGAKTEGSLVSRQLGVTDVTGGQATEERLLSFKRPRVLHIATHGFFFPPTISREERDLMRSQSIAGSGIRTADSPMLRSGLVFAGANNEAQLRNRGLADGWATALEIAQMDLRGTELVVLSACETARGDVQGAEGVFGLQRAFRYAGAQTLIMSLFKVPDDATQALMETFYRSWKPGAPRGSKLDALRASQLAMVQNPKLRHPRNWAGFVLMGDR